MPKIYRYRGLNFFFYSREHEPPHCHVSNGENIGKFKVISLGSITLPVEVQQIKGKFTPKEISDIEDVGRKYGQEILKKWRDHFNGQKIKCETIKKIK